MSKANPNPIVEAAFSDVPYILDSIWRWMEFRAYRLGIVTVPPPTHTFIRTSTTPWPFFLAYAVVSSLVVFGPTFTTLCQSFGWHVAEGVRILAGSLLTLRGGHADLAQLRDLLAPGAPRRAAPGAGAPGRLA